MHYYAASSRTLNNLLSNLPLISGGRTEANSMEIKEYVEKSWHTPFEGFKEPPRGNKLLTNFSCVFCNKLSRITKFWISRYVHIFLTDFLPWFLLSNQKDESVKQILTPKKKGIDSCQKIAYFKHLALITK